MTAYRWAWRLLPVLLLAAALLLWIAAGGLSFRASVGFGETLRHPNGLQTAVPEGYKLEAQTADGFRFGPSRQQRLINWIEVRRASAMPVLTPTGLEVLRTGERYLIEDMGGGSGGTEFQLTTWKEAGGAWIVVVAVEQSEFGRPQFAAGWAVIERSTLDAP